MSKEKPPETVIAWLLQHAVTDYVMDSANPKYGGEEKPKSRILNRKKLRSHLAFMTRVRKDFVRAIEQRPPELSEEQDAAMRAVLTEEREFLAKVERNPELHEHVWGEICTLCGVNPDLTEIELDSKLELLQAQGYGRVTILPGGIGGVTSTYPDMRRKGKLN